MVFNKIALVLFLLTIVSTSYRQILVMRIERSVTMQDQSQGGTW
jgi:hypothetical protein